jgi:UDP-N-acetylmuramate--alanine ligase
MHHHAEGAGVDRAGAPRGDRAVDGAHRLAGKRFHLIGIGGSGMSGAAVLLLEHGAEVSGSDLTPFEGMGELVERGARVAIGQRAEQIDPQLDCVVISAAIKESNPELAAARGHGIEVIKYAELLGVLMGRHQKGVAVAGTHGKSTTTAMCVHLFRQAGLAPSFLVGARSAQLGGSSGLGSGPHFIVEACEFDHSFLHLAPESAAILNIEPDHLDCYRDLREIVEAFAQFAEKVDQDGLVVCDAQDRCAREASAATKARVETFGFEGEAHWQAVNLREDRGCYAFDVRFRGAHVASTRLSIPGRYNVANALAALALAHHAGVDPDVMATALPTFAGIDRRLSWCGAGRGVTIVDDYAHHPTEIRVTIEAARYRYRPSRTLVVFQPHQHARTRHLMDDFADAFGEADEIIVPDVYGAREAGDTGIPCSQELVSRIRRVGGRATYLPRLGDVADHVVRHAVEGDLVLIMGAGDVWKVADELVERICEPDRA